MSNTETATKLRRWRRQLQRIGEEQIELLNRHLAIFRVFQETVREAKIRKGSETNVLTDWMALNYIAFATSWVRKIAEPPPTKSKKNAKKKNDRRASLSLPKLLEELKTEPDVLSFERFGRMFRGKNVPLQMIRAQWERNFGRGDSISKGTIGRDIRLVEAATVRVKKFVDKQVAHTAADRRQYIQTSFGEIREAVERASRVFAKYHLLVFGTAYRLPDLAAELTTIRSLFVRLWKPAQE